MSRRQPRYVGRRRAGASVETAQPVAPAPRHGRLSVQLPTEPRPTDHGFPRVQLPTRRPVAVDDTPPIAGKVVDETPKPVRREGLAPAAAPSIPVPSTRFLNDGAKAAFGADGPELVQLPQVAAPLGPDQTAKLSGYELARLGRPVPLDAPPSSRPALPRHGAPSREFDGGFWRQVLAGKRRAHSVADTLEANNDKDAVSLDERLDRLERRVAEARTQINARPLPHRTPGAFRAEIQAGRGLVSA